MLEVSNVEVVYHGVVLVLKGVSLKVGDGEITALLGPNGAGKTTLLRAITGLLDIHDGEITKGDVLRNGTSLVGSAPNEIVKSGVAQVMEGRRIFAELTVEENLRAGGYTNAKTFDQALEKAYTRFPILGERRKQSAGFLSGGEQQMLAIARALMSDPSLLILDEPSLGLAPKIIEQVCDMLRELNSDGLSILLVEQNAHVALSLADYGFFLENGRVVLDGTSEALRDDEDVREFYLGQGGDASNYRDVKRYRRKKRWLS